jgi:uncharacterized protein (TIGR02284 family)
MATMVGKQADVKDLLYQLVELDYDAVAAYDAAIARLKDGEAKSELEGFKRDHERHVQEVGDQLRLLGSEPPTGPDVKRVLTQGKVVIAGLMGDRAVLMAMKTNEDDTNTAYERATARADLAPELRALLQRNLEDERRHRGSIERRLQGMQQAAHP